ncbi:inositol monophosphatase family protein, partial [Devosia sp.]|uniref:inositol monophosphatase family protein n=1 Tax=Devosia sp. TaxID=1871048 RepID=UPI002FC6AEF3
MTLDLAKVEATLLLAAEAAAAHTLPLFRTGLGVDNKLSEGFDPVTEADRSSETAIRAVIAEHFPDHAIIGEEWGSSGDSPYSWIIDPIDGTRAFITGAPVWGTLIGFAYEGVARNGMRLKTGQADAWVASLLPGEA